MLQKFRSYQLAKELYLDIKKVKAEYYVKDQMRRAALSVALNLCEGAGKIKPQDKIRFYTIAHGSLRELQGVLDILELKHLYKKADILGAHIWKLIQRPVKT